MHRHHTRAPSELRGCSPGGPCVELCARSPDRNDLKLSATPAALSGVQGLGGAVDTLGGAGDNVATEIHSHFHEPKVRSSLPTPSRSPLLADVAAHAGVSLATASLALRNSPRVASQTQARVAAAARTLEYRPHRHGSPLPKRFPAVRVGVVAAIGLDELLTDPFQVTVIAGLVEVLEAAGATPTFVPPPNQAHHVALLARMPLTGVVLVHSPEASGTAWTVVSRRALPTVCLEPASTSTLPGVQWLDAHALEQLSQLIRSYGHTDALVVSLPFGGAQHRRGFVPVPDAARVPSQPVRQRLAALTDAGLTVSRVYETERSSVDEGERAGAAIATLGDLPTVIVCQSDVLAAGVMTALQRAGVRVPEDVSVTGFDGLDLPLIAPHRLTTVVQDGPEKGRRAATQLLQLISGSTPMPNDMTVVLREGTTLGPARVGEFVRAPLAAR